MATKALSSYATVTLQAVVATGSLTVGTAASPSQVTLRGNPANVMQVLMGDVAGAVNGAFGGRFSSSTMFISTNATQPTLTTDSWHQSLSTKGSAMVDLDYTSGATFRFAAAGTADGAYSSFWGSTAAVTIRNGGGLTSNGAVVITGSSGNTAGSIWKTGTVGVLVQGATGSVYDFGVYNTAASNAILVVPTGTNNVYVANGSLTVNNGFTVLAGGMTVTAGTSSFQAVSATAVNATAVRVSGAVSSIGANQVALDFSSGARLLTYGADASTNGTYSVISRRSDASNSIVVFSTDAAGAASIPSGPLTVANQVVHGNVSGTPADGSIWWDGTNFKGRMGGVTKTFTLT